MTNIYLILVFMNAFLTINRELASEGIYYKEQKTKLAMCLLMEPF